MVDKNRIIEGQEAVYRERFLEYGDTPRGVFWNDETTQFLRFERLVARLLTNLPDDANPLIHEVGAGTCALHQYLLDEGIAHRYSGTELVAEMVATAERKFPGISLVTGDFLSAVDDGEFDFVVLSGVFNMRGDAAAAAWEEFVLETVFKMFQCARKGIAFNFLTSDITVPPGPELHYIDPRAMLKFCQSELSRFVTVDAGYPLFEVTVTVLKPEFVRQGYSGPAFAKYFPGNTLDEA